MTARTALKPSWRRERPLDSLTDNGCFHPQILPHSRESLHNVQVDKNHANRSAYLRTERRLHNPGVTKKEKLKLTDSGNGSPSGNIIGTMAFDRKEYGMNSGIPFIKIANRVEVSVNLRWKRISGPPPVFEQ